VSVAQNSQNKGAQETGRLTGQELGLVAQAAAIDKGELDPSELLEATLAGIAQRDRTLNSTPVTFPEESRAMLAVAPPGPLRGVPLTIKDMFALPWRGAGNGTSAVLYPASASAAFGRLRDAGAVIVGIANQHEMGLGSTGVISAFGPARNPWNEQHCGGGSSGGSAAAVAARLVAGSLGSDSGGSTRLPAAYCGVTGLKITYASIPYDGYFGMGTTFSAPGVFGRDSDDARLLAEALLARPLQNGRGDTLRVGVVEGPMWDDVDPATADACRAALADAGWPVSTVAIEHLHLAAPAALARLLAEVVPPPGVLAQLHPTSRAMLLAAQLLPAQMVPRADRVRAAIRRELAAAFAEVDVLAWPSTAAPAPRTDDTTVELPSGRGGADQSNVRQAGIANLCGVPGISVPVGLHPSGLPVGLQLLAPWGGEALLLDAAKHLEQATSRAHVDLDPRRA
jgi:Asp-tRNA(Asn)/Glu-tRNA(Gln) amidotransferase A subunit family amidase